MEELILIFIFIKIFLVSGLIKNYKVETVLDYKYNHYLISKLFSNYKIIIYPFLFNYKFLTISAIFIMYEKVSILFLTLFIYFAYVEIKELVVYKLLYTEDNLLDKFNFGNKYIEETYRPNPEDEVFNKIISETFLSKNWFLIWKSELNFMLMVLLFIYTQQV